MERDEFHTKTKTARTDDPNKLQEPQKDARLLITCIQNILELNTKINNHKTDHEPKIMWLDHIQSVHTSTNKGDLPLYRNQEENTTNALLQ